MRLITAGTEYQFELTFFRRRTRKILNDRIGNRKGFWPVLLGFSRHLSTLVLFSAFPVAVSRKHLQNGSDYSVWRRFSCLSGQFLMTPRILRMRLRRSYGIAADCFSLSRFA